MAVVPFIPLGDPYQTYQPYISVSEYLAGATDVDTDNLYPGQSETTQLTILAQKIQSASGWANLICHQTLAATVNDETATGLFRRSDGTVWVNLQYWPLQQVNTFAIGSSPTTLTPMADLSGFWLAGRSTLVVPAGGSVASLVNFGGPLPSNNSSGYLMASWQYVNGWPLANLTAAAHVGDTVLHVSNTLAFYGTSSKNSGVYTVCDYVVRSDDASSVETITVASVGNGVLNLSTPLTKDHLLPAAPDSINVSGMPQNIKQAVIHLVSETIKTRGSDAVILQTASGNQPHGTTQSGFEDLASAMDLLAFYDRTAF